MGFGFSGAVVITSTGYGFACSSACLGEGNALPQPVNIVNSTTVHAKTILRFIAPPKRALMYYITTEPREEIEHSYFFPCAGVFPRVSLDIWSMGL